MTPKVSIIVPVYNAGQYLRRCLDTLVGQALRDIEIILVCDCPTDGSDAVCEEYAAKDSRIVVVKNEHNLHIGLTRNVGLALARGEYVGFSDHDDFRELDMYEQLYELAKAQDLDMVVGLTVNHYGDHHQAFPYPEVTAKGFREYALRDLIGCGCFRDPYPLAINIHSNIYRRSVIEQHHLRFVDTREVSPEDRLFNAQFLLACNSAAHCPLPLYYHRILPTSAMHSSEYGTLDKSIRYVDTLHETLKGCGRKNEYLTEFVIGAGKMLMGGLLGLVWGRRSLAEINRKIAEIKTKAYCSVVFNHYIGYSHIWRVKVVERLLLHQLTK